MDKRIEKTLAALKAHHFDAHYCETKEEAVALAKAIIPKKSSVTWGGSMTIRDMGLCAALKADDYLVYDRDEIPVEDRPAFVQQHYFSDWFLMSSNAITEKGELWNMDGTGNRLAALTFGPKHVLVIAGVNKLVADQEEAIRRVRTVAAPRNAQRFPIQTPCKMTGNCADCLSADSICCTMVYTRLSRPAGRVTVILVNDTLGY